MQAARRTTDDRAKECSGIVQAGLRLDHDGPGIGDARSSFGFLSSVTVARVDTGENPGTQSAER